MSSRRKFLVVAGAVLAGPRAAAGQVAGRTYRIGILLGASSVSELVGPQPRHPPLGAFMQRMRELGYEYGRNLQTEPRSAEGLPERFAELAEELVRLRVDVILGATSGAVKALSEATKTVPIVMSSVPDPVGMGHVASLARPGGNVTGLSLDPGADIHRKRLELLKDVVPGLSRVAVVAPLPIWRAAGEDLQHAAQALGIALVHAEVTAGAQFEAAFAAMTRERLTGLLVPESALNYAHRHRITQFAAARRLPAIYGFRESADAGGLMAYGADVNDLFRRAADYVDRILNGAKPGDLPVEQPVKFELVINRKVGRDLGIDFPPAMLVRADRIID